jgi:HK97 family phage portal protein
MRLIDRIRKTDPAAERAMVVQQSWGSGPNTERIGADFISWSVDGYGGNGIVFAVLNARLNLFTEARFKWRNLTDKRLFGNPDLSILENPWVNGSTGDLLARAEQDVFLSGNFFVRKVNGQLERLRPDRVEIAVVIDDETGQRELLGYVYRRDGIHEQWLEPHEVAHWTPIPDPLAEYRGMAVLTPIVREVNNDIAMTDHKTRFFENAATPNLVIKYAKTLTPESFARLKNRFDARYGGSSGDKTMILDDGADLTVVGNSFEQMSFTAVQAAGEARIAAAASVPPQVVGLQVGIEAGGYANYREAFKAFGSGFMRSHWRSFCAALETVCPPPEGAELWFDVSDIAALQDAETERADAMATRASTLASYLMSGFTPESAVSAVLAGDESLLKHTGALSVQLYPGGTVPPSKGPTQ